MLTIRENGLTTDTDQMLFAGIKAALADGKQVFLIVPEQQTLVAEKEAIDRLSPSDTLRFEVTNFSRLSNTLFRRLGGVAVRYANPVSKAVLIWRALSEAAPELSVDMARPTAANVEETARAISEMQSLGLDAETLADAAKTPVIAASKKLQSKLRDLSLILSSYTALTEKGFADAASDLGEMKNKLLENPEVWKGTAFFFDGFTSFTEPQTALIKTLLPRADLTFLLTLPNSDRDAYIYAETRKTESTLLSLCDLAAVKEPIEKRRIVTDTDDRLADPGFDTVARNLWRFFPDADHETFLHTENYIRMYEADSPYEEAAFIASDIAKRVYGGAEYSDFAVIAHDASSLDGVLKATLSSAGIPVFIAQKRKVTAYEPFMAIRAAYRAILSGYTPEDVMTFAKCGYVKASYYDISEFEVYVKRYKIKGAFFAAPEMWSMNPLGYQERMPEDAAETLLRIDKTRHAVVDPLLMLAEDTENAATVKEHAAALFRFLTQIGMEEKLIEKADALNAAHDFSAPDYSRLFPILLDTLDAIADSAGEVKADGREFSELLSIAFSAADIGRIPAAFDEVTLGIADTLRIAGKKYVYLVDVNNGVFPSNAKDSSHFSDKEKKLLADAGLSTSLGEEVRIARERFSFSRAFVSGSQGVTLITTKRNAALKTQKPAEILHKIEEMTKGKIRVSPISALGIAESVYSPVYAVSRLASDKKDAASLREALAATAYGAQMKMSENIQNKDLSLSPETAKGLYPDKMTLSDSRLSKYANCPFSHFCRYVLNLDEQKEAAVGAVNIGNIVHEVMERYFAEVTASPHFQEENGENSTPVYRPLPDDERKSKVEKIAREATDRLFGQDKRPSVQKAHFLERLIGAADRLVDSVSRELDRENNRFYPVAFELKIQNGSDAVEPLVLRDGTKETKIIGKVDRVDALTAGDTVYLRVLDYKTGHKTFSPKDLENGVNLQMFLYLRSILESQHFASRFPAGKKLKPAGVFYVPVSPDGTSVDSPAEAKSIREKNTAKYRGMVSEEPVVLNAVNSDYFKLTFTKSEAPDKVSQTKIFSDGKWEEMQNTVETHVKTASNEMRSGKIQASPMLMGHRSSCDYCSFRFVCRSVI